MQSRFRTNSQDHLLSELHCTVAVCRAMHKLNNCMSSNLRTDVQALQDSTPRPTFLHWSSSPRFTSSSTPTPVNCMHTQGDKG